MGPRIARSRKFESVSRVRTLTTIAPIRDADGSSKSTITSPAASEVTPTTRLGSPFSNSSISKRTDERSLSIRNTVGPAASPGASGASPGGSAGSAPSDGSTGSAPSAGGAGATGGAVTGALGSPDPPENHT